MHSFSPGTQSANGNECKSNSETRPSGASLWLDWLLRTSSLFLFAHKWIFKTQRLPIPSPTSRMPTTAFSKSCIQFTWWKKESSGSPPAIWKCSYLHKSKQTNIPVQKHPIICFLPKLQQKWSNCCGFHPAHMPRAPQGWKSAHSHSRDSQTAASVKNNTSELWLHLLFCSNEPMLLTALRRDDSCHHSLAHQFGYFQTCTHSLLPITSST